MTGLEIDPRDQWGDPDLFKEIVYPDEDDMRPDCPRCGEKLKRDINNETWYCTTIWCGWTECAG